jgi:hypothetical protein
MTNANLIEQLGRLAGYLQREPPVKLTDQQIMSAVAIQLRLIAGDLGHDARQRESLRTTQ